MQIRIHCVVVGLVTLIPFGARAQAPPTRDPVLAAWRITGPGRTHFEVQVDSSVAVQGTRSLVLRSSAPVPDTTWAASEGVINIRELEGNHLRVTAYLRTSDVGAAALWARVDGDSDGSYTTWGHDTMSDREITGTTGWTKYELVLPAPLGARMLVMGTRLRGSGAVWVDEIVIEAVSEEVPLTNPVEAIVRTSPYREPGHLQAFVARVSFERN